MKDRKGYNKLEKRKVKGETWDEEVLLMNKVSFKELLKSE